MGVKDYPVDLGSEAFNKQIVYSPHDYGPTVYKQPWFEKEFTYESLKKDAWTPFWLYIADEDIAPILIGEWGGFMEGDTLKWMNCLRQLIDEKKLSHTFWCFNANSGDTGGLVKDDFKTWDEDKYALVEKVLWKNGSGKYVGLDHKVPLGSNGISLSEFTGKAVTAEPETTAEESTSAEETTQSTTVQSETTGTTAASSPETSASSAETTVAAGTPAMSPAARIVLRVVIAVVMVTASVGISLFAVIAGNRAASSDNSIMTVDNKEDAAAGSDNAGDAEDGNDRV